MVLVVPVHGPVVDRGPVGDFHRRYGYAEFAAVGHELREGLQAVEQAGFTACRYLYAVAAGKQSVAFG